MGRHTLSSAAGEIWGRILKCYGGLHVYVEYEHGILLFACNPGTCMDIA